MKQFMVRRLTRGSVLSFAGIVLVTACSGNLMSAPSEKAEVQVTVQKGAYRTGDTVKVDVRNVSGIPLTYPCAVAGAEGRPDAGYRGDASVHGETRHLLVARHRHELSEAEWARIEALLPHREANRT